MAARVQAIAQRPLPKQTAWKVLENHYKRIRGLDLRRFFADDNRRGEHMVAEGAGIHLDYSKHRITDHTLRLLVQLAKDSGLQARIDAMFRGERINTTENRPALYVALRAPKGATIFVDGENVVPHVQAVLDKMSHFCNRVRRSEWKGYAGKPICNIVNIGIGGFDIGPAMAYHALKHYSDHAMKFRFISNVDSSDFREKVRDLDPAETLFIVSSKSFTTLETMTNARSARDWLLASCRNDQQCIARQFIAISNNVSEVMHFGIDNANVFPLWDWVPDTYSIGSAASLSTMLAIGPENFVAILDGCHQMDMHFLTTPLEDNLPVLMGLLAVWYVNLFGVQAIAVVPYEYRLNLFPAYVQHLAMGSNGKRVTLIGTEVTQATGPLYWGDVGGNGQSSFHQLIHQGTRLIPCDLIAFGKPQEVVGCHHDILIATLFAEAEALAFGKTAEEVRAESTPDWLVSHRVFEGNRPSTIILADQLTPQTLGKLIALYQHSVFTQGVIWNINSFDHWAGDLGESLAQRIIPELESADEPLLEHDSSTNSLIRRYRTMKASV
jgi:glucose-6-phosphate isomerase